MSLFCRACLCWTELMSFSTGCAQRMSEDNCLPSQLRAVCFSLCIWLVGNRMNDDRVELGTKPLVSYLHPGTCTTCSCVSQNTLRTESHVASAKPAVFCVTQGLVPCTRGPRGGCWHFSGFLNCLSKPGKPAMAHVCLRS